MAETGHLAVRVTAAQTRPGGTRRQRQWARWRAHLGHPDQLFAGAAGAVLVLALILGGSPAAAPKLDLPVLFAACGLGVWALERAIAQRALEHSTALLLAMIAILPGLQLVPLPYELWTALPGHAPLVAADALLGQAGLWRSLSIDPGATVQAWVSLTVPAALFLAVQTLRPGALRGLFAAALVCLTLGLAVALVQTVGGPNALRLHALHNPTPGGFFANSNHFALSAALGIVMITGLARGLARTRNPAALLIAAGTLGFIFLLLAIASRSRAGIAMAGLAALYAAFVLRPKPLNMRGLMAAAAVVVLAALLLLTQAQMAGVFEKLLTGENRLWLWQGTLQAGLAFAPWGSGFGTFRTAYALHETTDILKWAHAHQAHNEWLQIALEGGLPGMLLTAAFLLWLVRQTRRNLRPGTLPLIRTGVTMIWLISFAAIVDYPTKTLAVMALLGLACGAAARSHAGLRAGQTSA